MAIANGEEITRGELRAEAVARTQLAQPGPATQAQLLRAVMDRKLLAQAAKRAGLDQDIDFILAQRRSEEALLADLELKALSGSVAVPSDEDIDRFLREHPTAFLNQTMFLVDQINVRADDNQAVQGNLSKAKSLEDVSTIISRMGLLGQRSRTEWNSIFMPASLAAKLTSLSPERLFVHREGDTVIAANVLARTSVPLNYSDRRNLARQSLSLQKVKATAAARLDELRASAAIRLQRGFTMASTP